jgi:hypothetical protein
MSSTSKQTQPETITLSCPSAQINTSENVTVLGVINGTPEDPRLTYLADEVPVTQEVIDMAAPLNPNVVFRFAARCAGTNCPQFDGKNCGVAKHVANNLPEAVDTLPICRLRPTCRWWHQEGKAACLRCPQVVHTDYIRLIPQLQSTLSESAPFMPTDETS